MPSFDSLSNLFLHEGACFDFLVAKRVLLLVRTCACGRVLHYQTTRNGFRCPSSECRKSFSVFSGSFFSKCILPLHKIMHLAFMWVCKCTISFAIVYTGHSSKTICAYFAYFRQLICDSLDVVDFCIGAPDDIVELDESKFGKHKYNRGHAVGLKFRIWAVQGVIFVRLIKMKFI